MPVISIEPDFPFVFMTRDDGDALVNLTSSTDVNVTVSVGIGVASSFPVPGFSDPQPFTAFNLTSVAPIAVDAPPFEFASYASYDELRQLIYVLDTESTYWVLNVTDIVDGTSGSYDVVGSFPSGNFTNQFGRFYISSESDTSVLVLQDLESFSLYDLSDPLAPGTGLTSVSNFDCCVE